uniref:Uncharacterized protein n=1 Tax=Setaria digitata TaxID=48799 RepID=A0A915PHU7_9BILA
MLLRLCTLYITIVFYCLINGILAPIEVWPDPVDDGRERFPKPTSWSDKNYGQWCRNRTISRHIQCQMGSALYYYTCCGETGTECCFRLQPAVIAYSLSVIFITLFSLIFNFLLNSNMICSVEDVTDSSDEE